MSDAFARIRELFDIGTLGARKVLFAGCGSGGGAVALQLVMSGFANFVLVDDDVLEVENVIRHVCGRQYLGEHKTDALESVLRDRNPDIRVEKHRADIMDYAMLPDLVEEATVVVLATDNEPTRWKINELCVASGTPFVVGRVFTRGIGGEVFAYRPLDGGCLACLEGVLQRTRFRQGIHEIDLVSEEERDAIYGMDAAEIKDSPGLNIDISFITSFHARFVLDSLARGLEARPAYLNSIEENYVVWGNRPIAPFTKNFELQRINLPQQDDCLVCNQEDT